MRVFNEAFIREFLVNEFLLEYVYHSVSSRDLKPVIEWKMGYTYFRFGNKLKIQDSGTIPFWRVADWSGEVDCIQAIRLMSREWHSAWTVAFPLFWDNVQPKLRKADFIDLYQQHLGHHQTWNGVKIKMATPC